jgi:hypothetical protein
MAAMADGGDGASASDGGRRRRLHPQRHASSRAGRQFPCQTGAGLASLVRFIRRTRVCFGVEARYTKQNGTTVLCVLC